jgi:hypothetical protein|tara:strand:- start:202 stop:579 length:378 start_codon:yes stop_codon:yes gene_type:complete
VLTAAAASSGEGKEGAGSGAAAEGGAALFAIFVLDVVTQRYIPGCVLSGADAGGAAAPLLRAVCVTNEAAEGAAALSWNVLGTTLASSGEDGVVRLWSQSDATAFEDDVTAATTWTCTAEIHAHE